MRFETSAGPLQITAILHGSLMIEFAGKVIHVDPYSRAGDYATFAKADQIWITHDHSDHLDTKAIDLVKKDSTQFAADPSSAQKLQQAGYARVTAMKNGDKATVDSIVLEAVPAYNLVQERQPGVKYHPKGIGNGYVATFANLRVYIAGDTECIPEMAKLGSIDVAFVPINLPFTMPPEEAVGCIKVISPKAVIPYHQGQSDPNVVAKLLKGSGIDVRVLSLP